MPKAAYIQLKPQRMEGGRDNKERSGDDSPRSAMQQPAYVDGELLSFRTGQKHAVVERVQEAGLADPLLSIDQFGLHDGDLPSGATEADKAKL